MKRILKFSLLLLPAFALILNSCKNDEKDEPAKQDYKYPTSLGIYVNYGSISDYNNAQLDEMSSVLKEMGFTDVYLLSKGTKGYTCYSKNTLSGAPSSYEDRDLLGDAITSLHKYDIKVHPWLMYAADDHYLELHPEAGATHFRKGLTDDYVDILDQDYLKYMENCFQELYVNYPIDGLIIDHMRYTGSYYGWSQNDIEVLFKPKDQGGYGMTLEQYNEFVEIFATNYNYPISKDKNGRYVYDAENPTFHESDDQALGKAIAAGNEAVKIWSQKRVDDIDRICAEMRKCAPKLPVRIALMPEIALAPGECSLQYGQECNQGFIFSEISPMLYSYDFDEDATWVEKSIERLQNLGYVVYPSLQAYRDSKTDPIDIDADVQAVINRECEGVCLFRWGCFDVANVKNLGGNKLEITYYNSYETDFGSLNISLGQGCEIESYVVKSGFEKPVLKDGALSLTPLAANRESLKTGTVEITYKGTAKPNPKVTSGHLIWTKNWN